MSPYQFLSQLNRIPSPAGDGVRVVRPLNIVADLRTSAGKTLADDTKPAVTLTETNGLTVVVAASETEAGSFLFQVPADYDTTADELKINVLAGLDGATDTPALDATIYRKRAGESLSADLDPTKSDDLGQTAGWRTIDASGNGLRPGDVLTINLVTEAHTTDDVSIYAVEVQYKSSIVFSNPDDR